MIVASEDLAIQKQQNFLCYRQKHFRVLGRIVWYLSVYVFFKFIGAIETEELNCWTMGVVIRQNRAIYARRFKYEDDEWHLSVTCVMYIGLRQGFSIGVLQFLHIMAKTC